MGADSMRVPWVLLLPALTPMALSGCEVVTIPLKVVDKAVDIVTERPVPAQEQVAARASIPGPAGN